MLIKNSIMPILLLAEKVDVFFGWEQVLNSVLT